VDLTTISASRSFGGTQGVYSHASAHTRCTMRFGVYVPPAAARGPVPVLYWLSGLGCTEENFIVKAGAQRLASRLGLALVVPDTSPRGVTVPGDRDRQDVGVGAGFYVDATQAPWSAHYRMASYVTDELREVVGANFPVEIDRASIFGHSMGGHGALTIALRNPERFRSVSAFAPIASASRSPWGMDALRAYLGEDVSQWRAYDATALVEDRGWRGAPLLIDQGLADPFMATHLHPELLEGACSRAGVPLQLRRHEGYDHGYHFIATFVDDHLKYHAAHLRGRVT
jgi:S-formylglutathione hydrolase